RTREVGVRMALGATAAMVRNLMLAQGLKLAAIGLGLGLFGAAALGKLMGSVLYGVSPFDPLSLAAVALVLLAIGLLASWIPAWRATRIDPTEALRIE
ncbi:MAG: permease, partial [Opitutus sp.]|nr:permease [Opitutus sp.]